MAARGSMGGQDSIVHPPLDGADAHSERVGRSHGADVLCLIAGVHGNCPIVESTHRPLPGSPATVLVDIVNPRFRNQLTHRFRG